MSAPKTPLATSARQHGIGSRALGYAPTKRALRRDLKTLREARKLLRAGLE